MQLVEMHAFAIVCYLFTYRNYFTSSKSIHYISQQLARTCCKYSANPKISIHKQPQLFTAKVRFSTENNERKTQRISMLNDNKNCITKSFFSNSCDFFMTWLWVVWCKIK